MRLRSVLKLQAALALSLTVGAAYAYQNSGRNGAAAQTPTKVQASSGLVNQGRKHFEHYCRSCHDPQDGSRRMAPDLAGLYQRKLTPAMEQPVTDASISGHIKQGGPRMPPFPWLDKGEIAALLAYLKTL